MCTRMIPLTYAEATAVLDSRERTGRALKLADFARSMDETRYAGKESLNPEQLECHRSKYWAALKVLKVGMLTQGGQTALCVDG